MTRAEAKNRMASRLLKEFRPSTVHGDEIVLHDFEAEALADIIAEYVATTLAIQGASK